MPYSGQGPTPMENALGAVAGYLGGVQQKKALDYQKQQDAIANQQQAAMLALQQQQEKASESQATAQQKFQQSLYAPGKFTPGHPAKAARTGTYQQGPMKGKPKQFPGYGALAPQYEPGTGGYYTQMLEMNAPEKSAMTAAYAALANQRQVATALAPGKAQAYDWRELHPQPRSGGGAGVGVATDFKDINKLTPTEAFGQLSPYGQTLLNSMSGKLNRDEQARIISQDQNLSPSDKNLALRAVGGVTDVKQPKAADQVAQDITQVQKGMMWGLIPAPERDQILSGIRTGGGLAAYVSFLTTDPRGQAMAAQMSSAAKQVLGLPSQ